MLRNLLTYLVKSIAWNLALIVCANAAEPFQQYEESRRVLAEKMVMKELPKRALVVYAERYQNLPRVVNAYNDSDLMQVVLKRAGFSVESVKAESHDQLISSFEDFSRRLSSTNEPHSAVVALYFVGHGFQFADGQYFVPLNASSRPRQLIDDSVPISHLIEEQIGNKSAYTIVFIDSCRETFFQNDTQKVFRPYNNSFLRDGDMQVFYGFATSFGRFSYGKIGGDDTNGPFARALEKNLDLEGESINSIFGDEIKNDTYTLSQRRQNPDQVDPFGKLHIKPQRQYINRLESDLALALVKGYECVEQYVRQYPAGPFTFHVRKELKRPKRIRNMQPGTTC